MIPVDISKGQADKLLHALVSIDDEEEWDAIDARVLAHIDDLSDPWEGMDGRQCVAAFSTLSKARLEGDGALSHIVMDPNQPSRVRVRATRYLQVSTEARETLRRIVAQETNVEVHEAARAKLSELKGRFQNIAVHIKMELQTVFDALAGQIHLAQWRPRAQPAAQFQLALADFPVDPEPRMPAAYSDRQRLYDLQQEKRTLSINLQHVQQEINRYERTQDSLVTRFQQLQEEMSAIHAASARSVQNVHNVKGIRESLQQAIAKRLADFQDETRLHEHVVSELQMLYGDAQRIQDEKQNREQTLLEIRERSIIVERLEHELRSHLDQLREERPLKSAFFDSGAAGILDSLNWKFEQEGNDVVMQVESADSAYEGKRLQIVLQVPNKTRLRWLGEIVLHPREDGRSAGHLKIPRNVPDECVFHILRTNPEERRQ